MIQMNHDKTKYMIKYKLNQTPNMIIITNYYNISTYDGTSVCGQYNN